MEALKPDPASERGIAGPTYRHAAMTVLESKRLQLLEPGVPIHLRSPFAQPPRESDLVEATAAFGGQDVAPPPPALGEHPKT